MIRKSEEYKIARKSIQMKQKAAARRQRYERKQERKKRRQKKKLKGLDKYIIFSFAAIIAYTIAQTALRIQTGVTDDTLTTCFFGVFGGEVLVCALIKRLKLKREEKVETEKEENIESEEKVYG